MEDKDREIWIGGNRNDILLDIEIAKRLSNKIKKLEKQRGGKNEYEIGYNSNYFRPHHRRSNYSLDADERTNRR